MYDATVDRSNIFCLCQQTNVRRDELQYMSNLCQARCAMVAPQRLRRATPLKAIRQLATAELNTDV
jgi:hypothetical protein